MANYEQKRSFLYSDSSLLFSNVQSQRLSRLDLIGTEAAITIPDLYISPF